MRPDERTFLPSVMTGDDHVGAQLGHVAIDALSHERVVLLREETAALWLMTAEAPA